MRMVDVLMMAANGEIKNGSEIIMARNSAHIDKNYKFGDETFFDGYGGLSIPKDFLKQEVVLIEPKQKKYSIKLNIRGLNKVDSYVNYKVSNIDPVIILSNDQPTISWKTQFTKQEMKEIKAIREFLEDVDGKYELIEVEDDESVVG